MNQPKPLGALNPIECLTTLRKDVRAAILFVKDGVLIPNFIKGWRSPTQAAVFARNAYLNVAYEANTNLPSL